MRYMLILFMSVIPLTTAFSAPLKVGDEAPNWQLENSEGETIDYYKDSENKVSMVFFWSTSCLYCPALIPHLEVIYRKYRNKGLKYYSISAYEKENGNPVEVFEHKQLSNTLLLNGDEVAEQWGVKRLPGLYIVGKDKKIVYKKPAGVSEVLVKQNVDLRIRQALSKN